MLKIKILSVGKSKEAWLAEAIGEYEKRLQGTACLEWVFAKTEAQLTEWALREKELIALDLKGELVSSEVFSLRVREKARLCFLIGGAEGIAPEVLAHSSWRWSLSPLTFTHQMARLILAEQVYRALEIAKSSRYHK